MVMVRTPPKDIRLATTTGHVINLPASSEVNVPAPALKDALARGCAIADEDFKYVEEAEPVYGKVALNKKMEDRVEAAIRKMQEEKNENEWTIDGKPDAKALGRRTHSKVTKQVRDKVWNERFGTS